MESVDIATASDTPVSEEDRRIEGYHKLLHSLFKGENDVLTSQSVASFMGCIMSHSEDWKRVIPGFLQHINEYARIAWAAHQQAATVTLPTEENTSGETKK